MMAYTQLELHSVSTVWLFKDWAPVYGGYMQCYMWMVHCACAFQRSRVNCTGHYVKSRPVVKTLPNPLSSYHGDANANSQLLLNLKALPLLSQEFTLILSRLEITVQVKYFIAILPVSSLISKSVFKYFTIKVFSLSNKMGKLHIMNETRLSTVKNTVYNYRCKM